MSISIKVESLAPFSTELSLQYFKDTIGTVKERLIKESHLVVGGRHLDDNIKIKDLIDGGWEYYKKPLVFKISHASKASSKANSKARSKSSKGYLKHRHTRKKTGRSRRKK